MMKMMHACVKYASCNWRLGVDSQMLVLTSYLVDWHKE